MSSRRATRLTIKTDHFAVGADVSLPSYIASDESPSALTARHAVEEAVLERGHFFAPTVVEVKQGMEITRGRSIRSRWCLVIRVRDLEEGIKTANAVRYGLASTIFTRDVSKYSDEGAQAGIIHVNRPGVGGFSHVLFGGIKESGYGGREVWR